MKRRRRAGGIGGGWTGENGSGTSRNLITKTSFNKESKISVNWKLYLGIPAFLEVGSAPRVSAG